MDYKNIKFEVEDGIGWVIINRPEKMNAFNRPTWRELQACLHEADLDDRVYVLVITGEGKAFCAGNDIGDLLDAAKDDKVAEDFFLSCIGGLVNNLVQLQKPLIASVNGYAFGGGAEITMLCDMAIAADNAIFGTPEATLGVIPPIMSTFGPTLIGHKNAHELCVSALRISAQRAQEMGLVNKVVPADKLKEETVAMAKLIMKASPPAKRAIKQLLNQDIYNLLGKFSIALQKFWREVLVTPDAQEGTQAFLEKRKPKFGTY